MLRTTLRLLAVAVLLIVGALAWIAYRAHDAKARVHGFCARISVGQSSAELARLGREAGLEVLEIPAQEGAAPPAGTITALKGVMLARHLCTVEYSAGRVTKVETGFVD